MEAGILNADSPITVRYHAENGSVASFKMTDLKTVIRNSLYEIEEGPVLDWFMTVFTNWVKREPPEATAPMIYQDPIKDWIDNWLSDMTWGNTDPMLRPSHERYGSGEKTDPKDHLFVKDIYASLPAWAKDSSIVVLLNTDDPTIQGLIDYLTALVEDHQRISRMSVPDAIRLSTEWHQQAMKNAKDDIEGEDIQAVMTFKDGYRIVRILTPKGLDRESTLCNHCVGKGGYDKSVANGSIKIFSLRDKDNNPHVTMDMRDKNVLQIKGHGNNMVDPKVRHHVKDFILAAGLNISRDHRMLGLTRQEI